MIGYYYKEFKQKGDGVYKTIAAFGLAAVLGIFTYVGSLSLVDVMFESDGCGSKLVTAYIKDSVKKGFNPEATFGEALKNLTCVQE